MNLKIAVPILALAAIGLTTAGAYAQAPGPAPAPATPAPAPTELVYLPQLPTVASLVGTAKAEGVSIVKIDQKSSEIDVVYKDANGLTNIVSYQLLPSAETAAPAPGAPAAQRSVVYQAGPPVYYYDPYYYGEYYPWYWYAPIGLSFRFGGYRGWGGWGGHGYGHGHR
jgi:hypothetical protein